MCSAPCIPVERPKLLLNAGAGGGCLSRTPLTRVWDLHASHRLAALAIGMSFPIGRIVVRVLALQIPVPLEVGVLSLLYLGGLAILCVPLRDYRIVGTTTLIAALGFSVVGAFNIFFSAPHYVTEYTGTVLMYVAGAFVIEWGVPWGILSLVVLARTSLWPVFPPGHCTRCGYNLHGLPGAICPECGSLFWQGVDSTVRAEHESSDQAVAGEGPPQRENGIGRRSEEHHRNQWIDER